jgi:hypothetical protein
MRWTTGIEEITGIEIGITIIMAETTASGAGGGEIFSGAAAKRRRTIPFARFVKKRLQICRAPSPIKKRATPPILTV